MEEYETDFGQRLWVHSKDECTGEFCVIHNPSNHHMREWRTFWMADGHMFRVCGRHWSSHPDPDDLAYPTIVCHCDCKCCISPVIEMKCETLTGIFPLL